MHYDPTRSSIGREFSAHLNNPQIALACQEHILTLGLHLLHEIAAELLANVSYTGILFAPAWGNHPSNRNSSVLSDCAYQSLLKCWLNMLNLLPIYEGRSDETCQHQENNTDYHYLARHRAYLQWQHLPISILQS